MSTGYEISQSEFERKLRILSITVPLLVCIVSSIAAPLATGYIDSLGTIPQKDLDRYNALSEQISELTGLYYAAADLDEQLLLDDMLRRLADDEAAIMQKYNPDYVPRWPIMKPANPMGGTTSPAVESALDPEASPDPLAPIDPVMVAGIAALFVAVFVVSRPLLRRYLRSRYRIREPVSG